MKQQQPDEQCYYLFDEYDEYIYDKLQQAKKPIKTEIKITKMLIIKLFLLKMLQYLIRLKDYLYLNFIFLFTIFSLIKLPFVFIFSFFFTHNINYVFERNDVTMSFSMQSNGKY